MSELPTAEELGSLGVVHLKRYWSRRTRRVVTVENSRTDPGEWALDNVLINGLGVGLEQVARFLTPERSFEEFEAWILELNGGSIESVASSCFTTRFREKSVRRPLVRSTSS